MTMRNSLLLHWAITSFGSEKNCWSMTGAPWNSMSRRTLPSMSAIRTRDNQFADLVAMAKRLPSGLNATLRSEEHTSELQSQSNLVCRLLLEKKNNNISQDTVTPPILHINDLS